MGAPAGPAAGGRRGRVDRRRGRGRGRGAPGVAGARSLRRVPASIAGFRPRRGRRRWRALDLGTTFAFVEAEAPRVTCRRHGVVVCAVPWARRASRFTRAFEDQAAWLAVNTSKTAVAQLMRIAGRSVGAICERVAAEAQREIDLLAGLRRIGIDEISHGTGQRYLTVVVCHDTGRLVWAAAGRDRKTVEGFLDQLGEERCKQTNWCPATWPPGSPARSPSGSPTRRAAWIPSTSGRRAAPRRGALRGSLPRHPARHRRAGRDPPRGLERGAPGGPDRRRPRSQGRPLRAVEEPRAPHRP